MRSLNCVREAHKKMAKLYSPDFQLAESFIHWLTLKILWIPLKATPDNVCWPFMVMMNSPIELIICTPTYLKKQQCRSNTNTSWKNWRPSLLVARSDGSPVQVQKKVSTVLIYLPIRSFMKKFIRLDGYLNKYMIVEEVFTVILWFSKSFFFFPENVSES